MKRRKKIFKTVEKDNGAVYWKQILCKPLAENRIRIKDEEYDINPKIQSNFTNTKLTNKPKDNEDRSTVYKVFKNTGLYSMRHKKGLNSARSKDALYDLPKTIGKIRNAL